MAAAIDDFATYNPSFSARHSAVVTPSDTVDMTHVSRALWIGGPGDVYVNTVGGELNVPYKGALGGTTIPVAATRVLATGTTATSITAMW